MDVIESPADSVQPVKFKKDKREALIKHLEKEHAAIFNEREGKIPKWRAWVQQANSRLSRKEAGPRDSNLDMTLTRERMFQNSARLQTPIYQQDKVMVAYPRVSGPESQDFSLELERLMDYVLDRADLMQLTDDWVEQFQVFPYGVIKTPYVREVTRVKKWEEVESPEEYEELRQANFPVTRREFDDNTARYFLESEQDKTVREGCFPFVIPAEDFLFIDADNPDVSPLVTHRVWLTKDQVRYRIDLEIYDEKTPEGDKILDAIGTPSTDRDPLLGIKENENLDDDTDSARRYEILESYLCFDCGDGPTEIIVTWERTSCTILRAVHNFYHAFHRPFVIHQYKKIIGSMYGIPLAFFLEPLHRAYSASINQRLDAASKANEVMVMLTSGHPLLKQMDKNTVRGGFYENPGFSKDDVQVFNISQPFTQLPQLEQVFEHRADRISHLSPESFGEHTQDRPTATGTLQVLEESKYPQYLELERFRKSLALCVRHMLSRYQQAYPEGLRYYIQTQSPTGMQVMDAFFKWPPGFLEDEVRIETKVSSSTMSKSIRKQEVVALLEKVPQIYQVLFQLGQMAAQPGNPISLVALKLLHGLQATFEKFLKEFDVGEKEQLNPDLIQEVQVVQQLQQAMAQMQQAIQQGQQANANLQAQNAQLKQALSGGGVGGPVGPQPSAPVPGGMGVPPVQQGQS